MSDIGAMMKKIFIFLIFLLTSPTYAKNNYDYLISIINNELSEVSRLNKQINASDDTLLLRMAELYLERGRVKKELENEQYLSIEPRKRRKLNKNKFFKSSKIDMQKANKIGVYILKNFKNTKNKGDVFYVFAFYAQEYQTIKKAKKYFNLAKKYSSKKSNSFKKASLALADIFYNEKNFKKAIDNYENAIDDEESKWWTRDAYNLAWCYFREGQKNKGISLMRKVFRLSKKGFYLDFSNESQRDIVFFLVDSGKINDAERFVRKNGEKTDQLIKLAKNLIDQGKGSKAIYFLKRAQKKAGDRRELAEINNMLLDLHEKFSSISEHLNVSKQQHELFLSKDLDETLVKNFEYHIAKIASKIQSKIKSRRYQKNKKIEKELSEQHLEYVKFVKDVLSKKYFSYVYYQAEIYYTIGNFSDAAVKYLEVLGNKSRPKKRLTILNNLLACISKMDKNSLFYQKNAQSIFEKFIAEERRAEHKKPVYPLLFSLYLKNGAVDSAEKILNGYNKYFKNDMKTIESMLANLLEHSSIKNNKPRFLAFVKRINNREFIISKKLASSIKNNALSLQFKDVQSDSTKGAKANALRGYKLIYDDPLSSIEARKNAAFNVAVLFYELKYPKKTAEWTLKAIELMNERDTKKLFSQIRKISLDLFNQGQEDESLRILLKLANKSCKDSKDFRSLAADYFNLFLISSKAPRLSSAKFFSCVSNKQFYNELIIKNMGYFYISGDFDFLYRQLLISLKNKKLILDAELESAKLIAFHFMDKDPKKTNRIITLVDRKYNKSYVKNIYYKEIKALERMYKYRNDSRKISRSKLSFPEVRFNKLLKKKIDALSTLSQKIVSDPGKGGVVLIAPIYEILIQSYSRLISEINDFTPAGKSKEYVSGFKKSMDSLVVNLTKQRNEIINNLKKIVSVKEIVTDFEYDRSSELPIGDLKKMTVDNWAISDRGL